MYVCTANPTNVAALGGTPGPCFSKNNCATQPVRQDVQAGGVDCLPTQAPQLPAGASNKAQVTWTSHNLARGLQWCWSHPSSPKNNKDSFLGLECCVSYRPVWSSENVVQKEKKGKFLGQGCPPTSQSFWDWL
jgi:hypothetical protein